MPGKTVREAVEEGLGEVLQAKDALDEIYAAYAEPDADFDKLAAEQAKFEAIIAAGGSDTEHAARDRGRRAAPAAVGREGRRRCRAARNAAWRCAGCCSRSPTCCCSTSPPTTSTRRASTGWSSS